MIRKRAAHQRSRHGRDAVHAADEAGVDGPLAQGHGVGDDEQSAREEARGAEAGDGAADDEGGRVGRDAADERAELEDEEGEQEDPLDAEEGVELAEEQLEGARREQVGRGVPAAASSISIGLFWRGRRRG